MRWCWPLIVLLWTTFELAIGREFGRDVTVDVVSRPVFTAPGLTQIRDILTQLEAPIISALTERINLASNPALYTDGGGKLLRYIHERELVASATGRYDYGRLEYPFTLPIIPPDIMTESNQFPPDRFHQDTFSGNQNITSFYLSTLVTYFTSPTAYFYHLGNSTVNDDAVMNLDATLLALLSHRAHIGKVVAETKYALNITGFTELIKAGDSASIRTLVTNTTQETSVYNQASTTATAFSDAWVASGALVPSTFADNLQNAALVLFKELVEITTEIEIQYLLQRLD